MKKEELEKEECSCNANCDCGSNCTCNDEVKCSDECTCGTTCDCGDECTCDSNCECNLEDEDCTCGCNHEKEDKKKKKKKDKHEDKLNEAYNMISLLQDKLLREKAEGANYRKRKEEETSRMLKYSNEDIVKEILPIADNFERALSMSKNEEDEFFKGFKMIYCNLISVLEKYEVKAIDGNNKPFDPTYHEAVLTEEKEGVEPGLILEVMQKGYLLKDKVIRPAMVKVSI